MAVELELKLALPPSDAAALRKHALFATVTPLRRRVFNTYFDTQELSLARAHMALRLRRSNGRWLQTLKAGGSAIAGLHRRDEWEYALARGQLQLAMFAGTALDAFDAQELATQLRPVFSTDFMRTAWLVEPAPGTRIEVALDQGLISCGRRKLPISEVELELKAGDATALHALAEKLQQAARLRPDATSKAERGYRLFRNVLPQPEHFTAPALDARMSPGEALRLVAGASLAQVERNAAGVLAGARDVEFLHQARVGLRRLRSVLALAGRPRKRGDAAATALGGRVRPVSAVLGEARDWDVLVGQTLVQLLAGWHGRGGGALLAGAKRHRAAANEAARRRLGDAPWCATLLDLSRWLGSPPEAKPTSLRRFAAAQLARYHRHLLRETAGLAAQTPQQHHRARIAAKRMRYGTETFAALFARREVNLYLGDVRALQDALGTCNDAQCARRAIARLAPGAGLAAHAAQWLATHEEHALDAAQAALARLERRKHFWKKAPGGKKRKP